MSEDWREEWVGAKVTVAKRLASGECGGGYAEAVIVLCSVISALAAERWPGRRKDKKRFVELLHQYSDEALGATQISIPLLVAHLGHKGRIEEQKTIHDALMPFSETRVLSGDDVDTTEEHLLTLCPTLDLPLVRRFSYSNLLYEEIRSGYAHEYNPGSRSDSWGMGSMRADGHVSYTNRINLEKGGSDRLIYFSVCWLADIALSIARKIRPLEPDSEFSAWWLLVAEDVKTAAG